MQGRIGLWRRWSMRVQLILIAQANLMPNALHTTAAQVRVLIFFQDTQLISATTAGMAAMMTLADTAVVILTPNSMQIEKRKLPKERFEKRNFRVAGVMGNSSAGRLSQCRVAEPPCRTAATPTKRPAAPAPRAWTVPHSCPPEPCSWPGGRRKRRADVVGMHETLYRTADAANCGSLHQSARAKWHQSARGDQLTSFFDQITLLGQRPWVSANSLRQQQQPGPRQPCARRDRPMPGGHSI